MLREVDAALGRLSQNRYGRCVKWDEPISFARLRRNPLAQHCDADRTPEEQERVVEDDQVGHLLALSPLYPFKQLQDILRERHEQYEAFATIYSLDDNGKPQFRDLLFRQGESRFVAFDLPYCDGQDLRYAPLSERKHELQSIFARQGDRLLYCDHLEHDGETLFRFACENDLEGIVTKRKFDPYWQITQRVQGRNRNYSHWAGREELFEREPNDSTSGKSVLLCAKEIEE